MPFVTVDDIAGNGAGNLARRTYRDEYDHLRETLVNCLRGEHGIEEGVGRIKLAVVIESLAQACKNPRSILACRPANGDRRGLLRHCHLLPSAEGNVRKQGQMTKLHIGSPGTQGRQLETLRRTELAHNRNGILVQSIDRVIQVAHVGGGEFAGEISEGGAELREAGESGLANDWDCVVGRKVVAVVGEGDKAEGVDEAVRGIAGDNIDLMIEEGAVDEAEVHHVGLPGEVEAVQTAQGAEAVGALEEFVADAGAPLRRDGSDI